MKKSRYPTFLFIVLSLVYMMVYIQGIVMTVAANDIMRDMSLTPAGMGFLGSAYLYAYAGVMLFSGLLVAWLGPKRTLTVAFAVSGLGGLIFAASSSLPAAIVGRSLSGMGLATTMTSAFTLFSRWYKPGAFARLSALYFTFGGLGAFIAVGVLPLLNAACGWRVMFLFLGVVTLFSSLTVLLFVHEWPPVELRPPRETASGKTELSVRSLCVNFRQVAASLDFWRIVVWFATIIGSYFSFTGLWAMPYLEDVYGFSHARAGGMTSMTAVGFIIFTPLVAWFCESVAKSYRFGLGLSGLLAAATFAYMINRIDSLSVIELYVVMFIAGIVLNSPGSLGYTSGRNLFGARMTGIISGVYGASGFIGGALLQVLCGYLLKYSLGRGATPAEAYALAFTPIAVCGLLGALAGFTLSRRSYPESKD